MDSRASSASEIENNELTPEGERFRSNVSDVEVVTSPSTRKRVAGKESVESTNPVDAMSVSKGGMSTSRRPANLAFTQQRMFGWQPILTPYNVLPVLFILGVLFVVLGVVFLTASFGVQEYPIDYTQLYKEGAQTVTFPIDITSDMKGPVYVYYKLTNFYQNNRLYANSYSAPQLKGEFLDGSQLKSCDPLDSVSGGGGKVYYPCGLIANSIFTDSFSLNREGETTGITILSDKIAWPADISQYGKLDDIHRDQVVPPPKWTAESAKNLGFSLEKIPGTDTYRFTVLPDLSNNERFINWMKISGLPTFRKLYGRIKAGLPKGKYLVTVEGNYDVNSYKGTKSFIISTTNWAGGKNDALGYGFIIVGSLLLFFGLIFLVMFMKSPRKVGDISYLSWYEENAPEAVEFLEPSVEN